MTINRLLLLNVILAGGLSLVFLLPRSPGLKETAVSMQLPDFVGSWYGEEQEVSEREREVLAADTQFARKVYDNATGDRIYVSVVVSGEDMNNSIHRPERCLPAQGWSPVESQIVRLDAGGSPLPAVRLHNVGASSNAAGETRDIYSLHYYWFVGHDSITESHTQRALIDIRDRLLRGYNQQWAYVTVVATITDGLVPFGRSEEETDQMIREFIDELVPRIQKPLT